MKNSTINSCIGILLSVCWMPYANAQTEAQRAVITSGYDKAALEKLEKQFYADYLRKKEEVARYAREKGIPVSYYTKDSNYVKLVEIDPDGNPVYITTTNAVAAESTRTNFLHNGGGLGLNLEGQNMTAYLWEVGGIPRISHNEFKNSLGSSRANIIDGATTVTLHATHVAGTLIARGVRADAKGMAPQAMLNCYDQDFDLAEATSAAKRGALISNHSYGIAKSNPIVNWIAGAYDEDCENWDKMAYNAPYFLKVQAGGNYGDSIVTNDPLNSNMAYDKLLGEETAKNSLVVANADAAVLDEDGNLMDAEIHSSSSPGPTNDMRIKPDICGNGIDVYSCARTGNDKYTSLSGASMASPNVAGSLLLLQQHHSNLFDRDQDGIRDFMRAATLKGLALHTADDIEMPGPDAKSGWGLLNAKKAAEVLSESVNNGGSLIRELTLKQGESYTITVKPDGSGNPLMASISWTDPPGKKQINTDPVNDQTPKLVNNLNIRVNKNSQYYYPWRLTNVNTNAHDNVNNRDNFERVDIENPVPNELYKINITHTGNLTNSKQPFSLIITRGVIDMIHCATAEPTGVGVTCLTPTIARVSWNDIPNLGSTGSYEVFYKKTSSSVWSNGISVPAGKTFLDIPNLSSGTAYQFRVKSKCSANNQSGYSSTVTDTLPVKTTYCTVNNAGNTGSEYIKKISLAGTANSSLAGTQGYTDFTAKIIRLNRGQEYTLTFNCVKVNPTQNEIFAAWIDYNRDGDFTDENETVIPPIMSPYANRSSLFTVSANALSGPTRMRVMMRRGTANGTTPCTNALYGEIEDYTVVIYCPSLQNNSDYDWLDLVSLNTLNNNSGDNGGYGDFTNLSTNLEKGVSYELYLSLINWEEDEYCRAWIDYNNDGDFNDPSELILESFGSDYLVFDEFTVPASASLGPKRLRVMVNKSSYPEPCDGANKGETEDYTVNIINPLIPNGLTASVSEEQEAENNEIRVYPNPNDGENLQIRLNPDEEGIRIFVLDASGKTVMDAPYTDKLHIAGLESGSYIIRVISRKKTYNTLFIKQ